MDFEIAKVVKQVMDEVKAAEAEGLPVALPNYVRFDAILNVEGDDIAVSFEIPILRLMQYGEAWVDYSYDYFKKN